MALVVHADDYGMNPLVNAGIEKAISEGCLRSISLMANGLNVEEAVTFLKNNPHILCSLHLNLSEGRPTSLLDSVPLLIDDKGFFKYSFVGLWKKFLLSSNGTKKQFISQCHTEILAQIKFFKNKLPEKELRIDGHQHIHMIPFLFQILMEIHESFPIKYMRWTYEPFVFDIQWLTKKWYWLNLCKQLLLKFLAIININFLKHHKIKISNKVVGILFSGDMDKYKIEKALAKTSHKDEIIELMFHPATNGNFDHSQWSPRQDFFDFCEYGNREKEMRVLIENQF